MEILWFLSLWSLFAQRSVKHKSTTTCSSKKQANKEQQNRKISKKAIAKSQEEVQRNIDTYRDDIPLEPGMMVACYVPRYCDEEPQIGSVVSVSDEVVVEWMTGTYNEPWTVCRIKEKGRYIPWKETLHKSMILFPIELSPSSRISFLLKKELQYTYAQIRT